MPGKAKPCFPVGEGPEDSEPQPWQGYSYLRVDSELMVSLAAPSWVAVIGNQLKECWLKGPLGCHLSCHQSRKHLWSSSCPSSPWHWFYHHQGGPTGPLIMLPHCQVLGLALPQPDLGNQNSHEPLSAPWGLPSTQAHRHTALPGMARWVTVPN